MRIMTDVRDVKRHRKRMTLRFGIDAPTRLAFTEDISQQGMCIKTARVCPPGSRLNIELNLPDGNVAKIAGVVMWAKKVPPNMIRLVKKCGMGVRITGITSGKEEYRSLCEELYER
jgi:PilZ domain-containing protein